MRHLIFCITVIVLFCAPVLVQAHSLPTDPVGQERIAYDSKGKRDPFLPLITGEKGTVMGLEMVETIDDVRLEGVIMDAAGSSMAVINDTLLMEGEKQYSVTLKRVENNSVVIYVHDKEHTVYLITEGGE